MDEDDFFARLYFIVDYNGSRITVKDAYAIDWHAFPAGREYPTIRYESPSGVWRFNGTEWSLKREEFYYRAVVSEADDKDPYVKDDLHPDTVKVKTKVGQVPLEYYADYPGRHYDNLIIDDMADAFGYSISTFSNKDVALHKETLEKAKDVLFARNPWYDELIKKKGDDKMSKYLFHVIFLNTKTEVIDFKGYIPAKNDHDAMMLAAQTFGKYDPNVHATNVKNIMDYEVK